MRIDTEQPPRLGITKYVLRLIHLGENRQTAFIESAPVERWHDMPGRSLQKPNTKISLELLDRFRHGRSGKPEIGGSGGKAASLHNPGKQLHTVETIHSLCSAQANSYVN